MSKESQNRGIDILNKQKQEQESDGNYFDGVFADNTYLSVIEPDKYKSTISSIREKLEKKKQVDKAPALGKRQKLDDESGGANKLGLLFCEEQGANFEQFRRLLALKFQKTTLKMCSTTNDPEIYNIIQKEDYDFKILNQFYSKNPEKSKLDKIKKVDDEIKAQIKNSQKEDEKNYLMQNADLIQKAEKLALFKAETETKAQDLEHRKPYLIKAVMKLKDLGEISCIKNPWTLPFNAENMDKCSYDKWTYIPIDTYKDRPTSEENEDLSLDRVFRQDMYKLAESDFYTKPYLIPGKDQIPGVRGLYQKNKYVQERLGGFKKDAALDNKNKIIIEPKIDFSCGFAEDCIVFTGYADHWFFKLLNNSKEIKSIAESEGDSYFTHRNSFFNLRLLGQKAVNIRVAEHENIFIKLTEENWRSLVNFLRSKECEAAFSQHEDNAAKCNDDFLMLETEFKVPAIENDEEFLDYDNIELKAKHDQIELKASITKSDQIKNAFGRIIHNDKNVSDEFIVDYSESDSESDRKLEGKIDDYSQVSDMS